eukprot:4848893-Amphidinium_carterae.1
MHELSDRSGAKPQCCLKSSAPIGKKCWWSPGSTVASSNGLREPDSLCSLCPAKTGCVAATSCLLNLASHCVLRAYVG